MHELAMRIPETSELRVTVASAFHAVDTLRSKIGEIQSDKRLSPRGHFEKIKVAAEAQHLYVSELRKDLDNERKSLARRRDQFQIPAPDNDDLWSELRAQEIRAWLRSLPIGERIKHAATDPAIAAAAVSAPAALSGLNDDGFARAKRFLEQSLFGKELAVLDAEGAILNDAVTGLDVAADEIRREVDQHQRAAA